MHVITGLSTGGAEQALFNLLSGGLAKEFNCHVVSLSDEGAYGARIRAIGGTVHSLGMERSWPSLGHVLKLRRIVVTVSPDLIQGWMYHGNLAGWLARGVAPGRPRLAWNVRQCLYGLENEQPLTRHVIRANRLLSSAPDVLIYNCRLAQRQHEAFGFFGDRGRIIPNGFDLQRFRKSAERDRNCRQVLGIPLDALVLGHVARFHPVKNHFSFVRVSTRLAESSGNLHVLLIGRDVDSRNVSLLRLVPDQLRSRFHLLGERADINDLMGTMDVFCQSSWSEAFPNVLGEAMASSVPCVATDVGDSAVVVSDSGLMVPANDDDSLMAALQEMLDMTAEQRMRLGRAARARIEKHYGLDSVVERYVELYHGLS